MVQALEDAERDRLRCGWDTLAQRIESLPDGSQRDTLLEEQDEIEYVLGDIRLTSRRMWRVSRYYDRLPI